MEMKSYVSDLKLIFLHFCHNNGESTIEGYSDTRARRVYHCSDIFFTTAKFVAIPNCRSGFIPNSIYFTTYFMIFNIMNWLFHGNYYNQSSTNSLDSQNYLRLSKLVFQYKNHLISPINTLITIRFLYTNTYTKYT